MKLKKLFYASVLSAAAMVPQMVSADSQLSYGGSGTTATANLDFTVIIQDYVFLRVGTDAAQDRVEWDMSGLPVGQGVPLTATGGDLGRRRRRSGYRGLQQRADGYADGCRIQPD